MINDRWTLGATYQWDPKYKREDLASVRARYLMPNDGVINLSYRCTASTPAPRRRPTSMTAPCWSRLTCRSCTR